MRRGLVLVVDDDPMIRDSLRAVLESKEFRVEEAANGWEAIDLLQRGERADLIVCDWMMPNLDGGEFLRIKSRFPTLAPIPTIVISAKVSRATAQAAGATQFLPKPFGVEELLAAVDAACYEYIIER